MKVRVDADLCVGHGRCYVLADEVFEADDRGHCLIPNEEVPPELEEKARVGEQNCPEHAISIEE
ncbi:MAG: ferredoxin [Acidimicrobiia bacterium]